MATTIIKKYGNRRLYDTERSTYIAQAELTERIKEGADVRIIDAKTGDDLTQATLVQIVLETKAARLLPVPLLAKLIRMQDDSLGDFFSRYVSTALDLYLAARTGATAVSPYVPFATLPFSATNAFARALGALPIWGDQQPQYPQPQYVPEPPPPYPGTGEGRPSASDDVAAIRAELDELKRELRSKRKRS